MTNQVGKLGEKITAFWLQNQEYKIIEYRWHCRYGEIDLIAIDHSTLCFIEVKTRGQKNWDENGILAINQSKQEKLTLTAEIFLSKNSYFADYNCRFDVVLITYKKVSVIHEKMIIYSPNIILYQNYEFKIISYLKNAF